eukprot:GHVS01006921.1.p1 GENE.GHVS01006921.1~~GHVS01006921.1.p1  ORF type:complete len:1068 (+),score=170.97 GHVS01006921.1:275-3478(+)
MEMSTDTCQFNSRRCESSERCRRCSVRIGATCAHRRPAFNPAEARFASLAWRDGPLSSTSSHCGTTRSHVCSRRSPSPTVPALMALASSVANASPQSSPSEASNNPDNNLLTYQLQVARSNILTQTSALYQAVCPEPSVQDSSHSLVHSKTVPALLSSPPILANMAKETSSVTNIPGSSNAPSFHYSNGVPVPSSRSPLQLSQFATSESVQTRTGDSSSFHRLRRGSGELSASKGDSDHSELHSGPAVKTVDSVYRPSLLGPVAVRRRSSAQRMERLYSYEELNRKRPCTASQKDTLAGVTASPPPSFLPAAFTSSPCRGARRNQVSGAVGDCFFSDWPLELMLMLGYYLNGDDLGRMCSLNREWHYICTTLQQPLWQELVLKKYGFKYENYMLYTQLTDWHLMYAKANTFLKRLKNNAPYITPFKGLLRPAVPGYQGSLAMTADSSTLLWENGEYLQVVDVNEGISLYSVRVEGVRDPMTSHPCLVNTQTKIFLHLNKEIRVFCLATGRYLGNLKIPLEANETEGHWEPNDFSLDVSIRNHQVTFLAREALYVFDSETLEFVYKVTHRETTAEEGTISKDIDFLWAGYHCSSISNFRAGGSVVPRALNRSNSGGLGCSCGGSTSCRRKSRHIITWLRKASKNIKIFDVCSGKQVVQLEGHQAKLLRVRQAQNIYQLEDYFLASLDVSGVVRIWDSANNNFQCIHVLNASSTPLTRGPALGDYQGGVDEVAESGEECASTTFRLSFSSTHLMTMSECRGQSIRVHRDGSSQGGDEDQEPEEVQKAIVLKIWNFDAGKLSTRSQSECAESAATTDDGGERSSEVEFLSEDDFGSIRAHPEMLVEDVPNAWANLFSKDESMRREDALECRLDEYHQELIESSDETSAPPSTPSSPFYSIGTAGSSPRSASSSVEAGVLEVYGSYVLPDNAYFADFLDNQLVGVWMSKTTREVDFSSTLSDWSVFNCLQPAAQTRQQLTYLPNCEAATTVTACDGEHTRSCEGVDLQSLKDSYVFRMQGRGDIWTLLDWKCISINSVGDVVVYDFCPIADAAKKGRHPSRGRWGGAIRCQ